MNARECFQSGDLAGAIAAATDEVKHQPTQTSPRGLLAELLCFAGELDRADKHLDTIGHQDPQAMLGISLLRQLVRAELARKDFYLQGRLPEFLGQPPAQVRLALEASICVREGKPGEAAARLSEAEQLRPHLRGTDGNKPFDDFRDVDDLTSTFFEVFTSTGKYYWIPNERIERIEFHAPERPRDLLWRRAHMVVTDGPDGEVFVPALYYGSEADPDDRIKLGRMTDWRGAEGEPVRGFGQRLFLVGDEARPILEIEEITFVHPETDGAHGEDTA
ncbi:MAG: type VI secretion system accessory protein TagJ [Thermoguttaceae bacterium]